MNKRFLIFAGSSLVIGGLIVLGVWMHNAPPEESAAPTEQELRRELAARGTRLPPSSQAAVAIKPIAPNQTVRLAIGWLSLSGAGQNEQVADLVLTKLSGAKNLQTIERQALEKVLQESALSLSGLVRAQSAVKVGKLLRADWFLLGSAAQVNGTNYVVVRVVDARTGVMRDAAVFGAGKGTTQLATDLAAFIVQSRAAASQAGKPREYLAIGSFQDLSLNDRQADFADKLRGYLTATFQNNTNVALLEREFVDTLLQEVRLDLAGLTEDENGSPQPLQSAFWLVDGNFQSYEVSGPEVEVVVRVNRIFGRMAGAILHAPPGEPLFREIASMVESNIVSSNAALRAPTRRSEVRAQFDTGEQLIGRYVDRTGVTGYDAYLPDSRDRARAKREMADAIRAFQTVLILDPDNRESKVALASCYLSILVGKVEEARSLLHEVADAPTEDKWTGPAMAALGRTYRGEDPGTAVKWLRLASAAAKRHPLPNDPRTYYRDDAGRFLEAAETISAEMKLRADVKPGGENIPELLLNSETEAMQRLYRSTNGFSDNQGGYGIEKLARSFGTNRVEAASKLNELLPGLLARFPDLEPDLIATALCYQVDTNSPVVARFKLSFEKCAGNPGLVLSKHAYFWRLSRPCYDWCMANKMYDLAFQLVETKSRMQAKDGHVDKAFYAEAGFSTSGAFAPDEIRIILEDKMRMVHALMGLQRWRDALNILEGVPELPFFVGGGGPWSGTAIPTDLIDQCREKLGMPPNVNERMFKLGEPFWEYHAPGLFITDADSLWLVACCRLWQVDLKSGTNVEIKIPKQPNRRITSLCNEGSKLWIGTAGEGLFEYDKSTHEFRHFTEKEGLWVNDIMTLYILEDKIWIGYGDGWAGDRGGVGTFDLRTERAVSYVRSLSGTTALTNAPPPWSPDQIISIRPGEVLFSIPRPRRVYRFRAREDDWSVIDWEPSQIVMDAKRVVLGLGPEFRRNRAFDGAAVAIQNRMDGSMEKLGGEAGFPSLATTAVALVGNDLWVGGGGYVGVVDLSRKSMRKMAYTKAGSVDHIEVAGDYVWIQMAEQLFRVPISATR